MNANIYEDLIRLRDELAQRAFDQQGRPLDTTLAEVVFKINSCLGKGYPRGLCDELSSYKEAMKTYV